MTPTPQAHPQPPFESLDEDQFEARFESLPNPEDGNFFWAWDQLKENDVPDDRIWTVVEGDEDATLTLIPGVHYVNRVGYAVTQKPWPHENIDVVLDD